MRFNEMKRLASQLYLAALLLVSGLLNPCCLNADPIPATFDKNIVQFIFARSGETNYTPVGTCFAVKISSAHEQPHKKFLGLPLIDQPSINLNFLYFVTAKHVLFDENGKLRPDLFVRLSKANGGVQYDTLTQEFTNDLRILTHPDKSVDIAVITFKQSTFIKGMQQNVAIGKNEDKPIKVAFVDAKQIADKPSIQKLSIREGDEMFFVGLFTHFYGYEANIPICRFGRLSMLTDEKIPWGNEGPQNLYMMETEAFGGNSGSPAFFNFGKGHKTGNTSVLLAGIVKGYFPEWSEVQLLNSKVTAFSPQNSGVAVIVPAYQIQEVLFSDEEKKIRSEIEKTVFPHERKKSQ